MMRTAEVRRSGLWTQVFLWVAMVLSGSCGGRGHHTLQVRFSPVEGNPRQFVSDVIDFGPGREVQRWGTLSLDVKTNNTTEILATEYCLTNNGSPRIGNYFTSTRSVGRGGVYSDYQGKNVGQVYASHDGRGGLTSVSYIWAGYWASAKYETVIDFKQSFSFTRVEVGVTSNAPNQYLPHILVYAGPDTTDGLQRVGDAWFPDEARERLTSVKAYGTYEISAELRPIASGARFLKIVFDKPQMGISAVLIPYARVWGRVRDLSQLMRIQIKAASAAKDGDLSGQNEEVFKEARWEEFSGRIGCPENRFLRLLLETNPLYELDIVPKEVEGRLEANVL